MVTSHPNIKKLDTPVCLRTQSLHQFTGRFNIENGELSVNGFSITHFPVTYTAPAHFIGRKLFYFFKSENGSFLF